MGTVETVRKNCPRLGNRQKKLLDIIFNSFSSKKENAVKIDFVSTQGILDKGEIVIFH